MKRKNSLRLPYVDYTRGWFLITVNSAKRMHTFGTVTDARFSALARGEHIEDSWLRVFERNDGIEVAAFQLMPNHLHGVVGLNGEVGTLGDLVGVFKSRVSREVRLAGLLKEKERVWHRGYHARRLRTEESVQRAAAYVARNPSVWWDRRRRSGGH
jgi:putative transposase